MLKKSTHCPAPKYLRYFVIRCWTLLKESANRGIAMGTPARKFWDFFKVRSISWSLMHTEGPTMSLSNEVF